MDPRLVVIKGGGDLASGVAHRLHQAGFSILITELARPLVVRRTVAFGTAVLEGQIEVEGVCARLASHLADAQRCMANGEIVVMVDPCSHAIREAQPTGVVDARMAKTNLGTTIDEAPIVVALGPGFTAGVDVHAVVETNRGHNLGRVYYCGSAEPDTDVPAPVKGFTHSRVLRAPIDGEFCSQVNIGEMVPAQTVVGHVGAVPVVAAIAGVVRGLIASGTPVAAGLKIGDIDPSGKLEHCYTISDKSRAIGGGVLEAILHLQWRVVG